MKRYAVVDKHEGETPLYALEEYRRAESIGDVAMTYAGRLDPMASGKLLILIGDECKRRDQYDALDKEYVFEILFGFTSDTGDILGMSEKCAAPERVEQEELETVAREFHGPRTMLYPAFSSKTVAGKPLFAYALSGELHTIQIPSMDVRIYGMRVLDMRDIAEGELLADIETRLMHLRIDEASANPHKDFRRDQVLARWREQLSRAGTTFCIARMRASVSSGTYIRSLAPLIADHIGACGLAYSIRRTRIGRYRALTERVGFWSRSY